MLLSLLCTCAHAQDNKGDKDPFAFPEPTNRVYPISAKFVRSLLKRPVVNEPALPDLGNPLPEDTDPDLLPNGHYLHARVDGEVVTYEYQQVHDYQIEMAGEKGKFQLRLYDRERKERTDAQVFADDKPVRYSSQNGRSGYRRRDWKIDLVEIHAGADTLFYEVKEGINRSRIGNDLRYLSYKQPVRTLVYPYRLVRRSVNYLRRSIGQGDWRWYSYPLQRYINPIIHPADVVGYATTSQPKYRPGDTLQLSVYLTMPKGRPLAADSVEMVIYTGYRTYPGLLRKNIARNEKGRYNFEMPIDPAWPLDKEYKVMFLSLIHI